MNISAEILKRHKEELAIKESAVTESVNQNNIQISREQFDALPINKQVEYINHRLSSGESITSICKSMNIPDSTLRTRFNTNGFGVYKPAIQYVPYDKESYDKDSNEFVEASNNELANVNLNNQVLQNIIDKYTDMYNKLEDMYNWYETSVVNKDNVIDYVSPLKVDDFEGNIVPRSYKLYESVAKEFAEFCKANNKYKIQDILSQFIREGIDKYSYKEQD